MLNEQKIRDRLSEIRMSVTELALLMDVSKPTLHSWLSGKTEPKAGQLFQLAKLLNLDPEDLVLRKEES